MIKNYIISKKTLARAMYIMSFAMLFFSVIVLTMAYSVSSIKKAIGGEGSVAASTTAGFNPSPGLTVLASIKTQFPAGSIKTAKGKTIEERYAGKTNDARIYETLAIIERYGAKTDRDYCEKFWEMNAAGRYEISLIASGDFNATNPVAKKYSREELYSRVYKNTVFSAAMMSLAVDRGDVSFALDAAAAHLSFSNVLPDCFITDTIPIRLNYLMPLIAEHEQVTRKLLLEENSCFHTAETILKLAKTLEKRVRFIDSVPTFKESVENESQLIKKAAMDLPVRDKLILGTLNLWYGDPHEPYHELARELANSGKSDYSSVFALLTAAVKKHPRVKNFDRELAYTEDGLIPFIKFIWFAAKNNPLAVNVMSRIPLNMLSFIAKADARFRLITLGGLARFFYYENGRWPDLSKDAEFVKKAGRSAIDPYTGTQMKSKSINGGSLMLYCHWKDGINSPAESETTEIEVTAMPPDVLKK
ncbi:MAG TPA: hypothetical protein PKK26_06470 [Candidatus Wallbacteria bacterium]|nr:hypothetical protein [Candidatus Wallbacteria bacterium]